MHGVQVRLRKAGNVVLHGLDTMAAPPYFALPLATWQLPQGSKKRKREENGEQPSDEQEDGDSDEELRDAQLGLHDHQSSQASEYSAVLSPDEVKQYRAAGLRLDEDIPNPPFPHAAVRSPKSKKTAFHTAEQVASSFQFPVSPSYGREAPKDILRFQHLRVLTTILHKCLIGGDFIRAGRAWGMLLRHEFGGHASDFRSDGRWGIGAEILLRRDAQLQLEADPAAAEPEAFVPTRWFTQRGFEDAKRYYERLIVQYPYYQQTPRAISAMDFYPAMFGLWIYVVQEEAKAAQSSTSGQLDRQVSLSGSNLSSERHVWNQATEIAARMDALLGSPFYAGNIDLLMLRGMVGLWLADLSAEGPVMVTEQDHGEGNIRPGLIEQAKHERLSVLGAAEEFFKTARRMKESRAADPY